jgi:D-alanyl-D-alanine carboxypeptidase
MTFDILAQQVFEQNRTPGFALSVCIDGQVAFAQGYGVADLVTQQPVMPETPFAIGSLTKQFTAAAILLLQEEGKLSLEDTLESYVPAMPNGQQITLRMLLNQTSGLHNFPNTQEHDWPREGIISPDQLLALLKTDKPDFHPGEQWAYSNANYAMLAQVVTRVSGVPYGHFLASAIFQPLRMDRTGNGFAAQAETATPYEWTDHGFAAADPRLSLDLFYGAGSLVSTARDLARWNQALLTGQVLQAESLRELWAEATLPNGTSAGYAMGFVPATFGSHRELWHNGYTPHAGGYCFNAIFLDDGLAIAVLANASPHSFRAIPENMVRDVLALCSR